MATLTIQIPDKDRTLFEQLAKRFNGRIIEVIEEDKQPNTATKRAISDARAGRIKKIENLDLFFKSL